MRWIILLCVPVFCDCVKSQNVNLVPNSGFEEYFNCPLDQAEVGDDVPSWNDNGLLFGTADYFNVCGPVNPNWPWISYPPFGIPTNACGFQQAHTGNAYAGIITFPFLDPNVREYVVANLLHPMTTRTKYIVSFYVSLADSFRFSTSKLGALLTKEPPLYTTNLCDYIPQIQNNNTTNQLTDKSLWVLVCDTFEAGGGENYITIGNFFNKDSSDIAIVDSSDNYKFFAYYYIDDVSVIELDTSTGINESSFIHFQVFPNPAQNSITINNKASVSVSIYSLSGSLMLTQAIKKEEPIDIGQLPNGLYFVAVGNRREKLVVCR
jgi:hypothetical protein